MEQIEISGGEAPTKPRRWECRMKDSQKSKIEAYRGKWENYLKLHNNTSSKEVWKIYDKVAAELIEEQMASVMEGIVKKDLDRFVEQVIFDEFQV